VGKPAGCSHDYILTFSAMFQPMLGLSPGPPVGVCSV
jgi:hypothetical protein